MPRALNRITKGGLAYYRPVKIEVLIETAIAEGFDENIRRARIRDTRHPDYMCMECLVHVWREAQLTKHPAREKLLFLLLTRSRNRLKISIASSWPNFLEVRDDVLQDFSTLLSHVGTNHDATLLDIFECKFNMALARIAFKYKRQIHNDKTRHVSIPDENDEGKPIDQSQVLALLSRLTRYPASQEDYVILKEVLVFIETLPPAQRRAIKLCCFDGYPPASEDKTMETAASICGISGTAIYKSLEKATAKLKKYFEES